MLNEIIYGLGIVSFTIITILILGFIGLVAFTYLSEFIDSVKWYLSERKRKKVRK